MTTRFVARSLSALALAIAACLPAAAQVGVQRQSWTVPDAQGQGVQVAGMVWYPSAAPAASLRWGPFDVHATPGAPATAGAHPLVLVSHGTGGHELAHAWLAERLAAQGYVVLSLRHAGDNYEDRSAVARPDYFTERPRQVSRVLDQFLAQPAWAALVDPQRIAALGHSAGGYTVLALAGARPDRARVPAHCGAQGEGLVADAVMCRLGGFSAERPAPAGAATRPAAELPDLRDPRIRAVVADAPLGQPIAPDSLAAVQVPVRISYGSADEVLTPRFHGQALCQALPQARCERSEGAGHFALFQAGTGPMGSAAGDAAADPAGFDRRAWQAQAGARISAFLADALK